MYPKVLIKTQNGLAKIEPALKTPYMESGLNITAGGVVLAQNLCEEFPGHCLSHCGGP